ncbi:MAG: ABC transporter ATP-binding protein [Candidatus Bathyarchaeia archaeon]
MTYLEIQNVTKRFAGLIALKSVSINVEKGEILGLIGPNGAGKTTLFNIISGVYSPDNGIIRFDGEEITGLRPSEICKKGIARTFQIVKPFPKMSVLNNVIVGALLREPNKAKAVKKAEQLLTFTGLIDKKDVPAGSLTLADRKRLELTRALATDPKMLLLDEVVAGLNPVETDELTLLLRQIRKNGITLFMVEHVMRAIMSISDRIVVLSYGEKIAEGTPSEVAKDERVIKAYLGEEYPIA